MARNVREFRVKNARSAATGAFVRQIFCRPGTLRFKSPMASARLVSFSHKGAEHVVCLYSGMPESELRSFLASLFHLKTKDFSLQSLVDGQLVSVSEAAARPEHLSDRLAIVESRSASATKPHSKSLVVSLKSKAAFEAALIQSDRQGRILVVEIGAGSCDASRAIGPAFDAFSHRFADRIACARIDVEQSPSLGTALEVTLVPVYQFFDQRRKVGELVGPTPQELLDMLHLAQHEEFVARLFEDGAQHNMVSAAEQDENVDESPESEHDEVMQQHRATILTEIVTKLARPTPPLKPLLSDADAACLLDLIDDDDEVLMAVYQNYIETRDMSVFVARLLVLAARNREQSSTYRTAASAPAPAAAAASSTAAPRRGVTEDADGLTTVIKSIQVLASNELLSADDATLLTDVLTSELMRLRESAAKAQLSWIAQRALAGFIAFEVDGDVLELVDIMHRVADTVRESEQAHANESELQAAVADENAKTQRMLDVYERLAMLLKLHDSHVISARATSNLYALVEADDAMVGAAFELYKSDNDLTDLVDTLLRVAGQRFPESAVEEPVEQASEDITSWSELARAVIGHVCADRQFSADEALRLTELIVQRDTSLLGVIEVLISQGASWSNLLSALHRFISTLIEREAEQAPLMQHSDSNTYGSVGSRASSRQSIAATDSRSETPLDREVASVLTSPLSLREGMQRLLDMMLRDGTLQSAQLDWLMTLVDQREPVLMAAFQVLLEDGVNSDDAFDEFEDTVLRLVQLRFPASSSVKSTELESPRGRSVIRPDSPPPPDAASRPLTAVDDEAGEVADDGVRLLHDELVFLRILGDEGLLSDEDCVLLQGAVLSGDVVSRAALDLYRETGDMEDLIDTLLRCADQERQRMIQDSIADESDSEVDDQDEDAMNEVDYFSADSEQASNLFASLVDELHSRGILSGIAHAVLLARFQAGDIHLRVALGAFLRTNDPKRLRATIAAYAEASDEFDTELHEHEESHGVATESEAEADEVPAIEAVVPDQSESDTDCKVPSDAAAERGASDDSSDNEA